MIVKFNSTEEYIDELRKNASSIKNNILRITKRAQFTSISRRLFITATYIIGDEIIRLDRYVGDLVGEKQADNALYRQADAIMNSIEKTAKELKIDSRAGLYE